MNYQNLLINQISLRIRGEYKMKNEKKKAGPCAVQSGGTPCCKVEALVPIDARGQIVLPKDVRDRAGLAAGDKLAVVCFESGGEVCCITLVKADTFAESVKGMLGPVMTEILQG
jgi:AbrB family looped-hinge helix DNA binding protein